MGKTSSFVLVTILVPLVSPNPLPSPTLRELLRPLTLLGLTPSQRRPASRPSPVRLRAPGRPSANLQTFPSASVQSSPASFEPLPSFDSGIDSFSPGAFQFGPSQPVPRPELPNQSVPAPVEPSPVVQDTVEPEQSAPPPPPESSPVESIQPNPAPIESNNQIASSFESTQSEKLQVPSQVELLGNFDDHPEFPSHPNFFSNLEQVPVYTPQYPVASEPGVETPVEEPEEEPESEVSVEEETPEIEDVVDLRAEDEEAVEEVRSTPPKDMVKMKKLVKMAVERLKDLESLNKETESELVALTPVAVGEKVKEDSEQNMEIVMVDFDSPR
jgi:hypothetical protein